jgi:hypothetical protein
LEELADALAPRFEQKMNMVRENREVDNGEALGSGDFDGSAKTFEYVLTAKAREAFFEPQRHMHRIPRGEALATNMRLKAAAVGTSGAGTLSAVGELRAATSKLHWELLHLARVSDAGAVRQLDLADISRTGLFFAKPRMARYQATMEQRVNLITLGVSDLKRARTFYEQGLGWKASPASQGDVVFIQLGSLVLSLYPRQLLAEDARVDAKGEGFRGFTLAHNVRTKTEVAQVLCQAEAAGGKILKPAQDVFWGGHSGYFSDPDGTLWEVAWNPILPLDERGVMMLPT